MSDLLSPKLARKAYVLRTPKEINDFIVENESELAAQRNKNVKGEWGEFLVCDEATDLMSALLIKLKIPFKGMVGINDHGDSHSWIMVGNKVYDPTAQGCHEGQVAWTWDPVKGGSDHKTMDPNEPTEEYWKNVVYLD